jgi:hypothetical protein
MPFVVNNEEEGVNISTEYVEIQLYPSKKKNTPSIGIYFQVISDEKWSQVLADSLDIKTVPPIKEDEASFEDIQKYKEEVKESMFQSKQFERDRIKEYVYKIICLTKEGIQTCGQNFGHKEVMFEKVLNGKEDITPEEQIKVRDTLLGYNASIGKEVWDRFKDMTTGKKD